MRHGPEPGKVQSQRCHHQQVTQCQASVSAAGKPGANSSVLGEGREWAVGTQVPTVHLPPHLCRVSKPGARRKEKRSEGVLPSASSSRMKLPPNLLSLSLLSNSSGLK